MRILQLADSNAQSSAHKLPSGIRPGTRITESYARMVIRDAYFWAWPMVNIYNRRLAFEKAPEVGLMNGVLPFAPLNSLSMLNDYVVPEQRWVACPNQDVVYGAAITSLEKGPVVIQVPDFGSRFWVYQIIDLRTDSFADVGAMYDTKPGFYLLAQEGWEGEMPAGIEKVFRSHTGTAMIVPRVFQDDTAGDKQAVQALINQIDLYPLASFDGKMKQHDWSQSPTLKSPMDEGGSGETRWVFPDKFLDELPLVLKDAPPLPGEELRYAQLQFILDAVAKDPPLKRALTQEVAKVEKELVDPLLQFRNFGVLLPHHWTTEKNGAAFGSDYFMRTAIAKSNIMVNKPNETAYFYQDLDESGARLNSRNRYTVTFTKDQLPPVKGFWSLTMYDEHHFFVPNEIKRYSLGTKNKDLRMGGDGSLTLYVQSDPPSDPEQRANWLPAPKMADFTLYLRAYWPDAAVTEGTWTPPAVVKASSSGATAARTSRASEQQISDSYIYLLSRLLVLRQQQLDFKEGFQWNQLVHRKPGEVTWPNPNLDVAYSEAWVAVGEKSCVLVTVPKVVGRYYSVQLLNGWGETVANLNERFYPQHASGEFAVCLKGSDVRLPAAAMRVDVPVKYMRVLSRVELGSNWDEAVALQKRFDIRAIGEPVLPTIPQTVMFEMNALPGVEAFESAEAALDSEVDINPGMEALQASTRAIAKAVKDPSERQRVDQAIRTKALADFQRALPTLGDGKVQNGWALPVTSGVYGSNWLVRTIINYGGIWANIPEEVIYYKALVDPKGKPLSGDNSYTVRFAKDQLPAAYASYFWSVIAVDSVDRRVLPNPLKRYLLNKESELQYGSDGSLTLYFADAKPADAPEGNWLPTPKGVSYSLTFRFYRPKGAVAERTYFPPPLVKQ